MAECSISSDQLSATLVSGSDAIDERTCDLCSEDGLYLEAEGFCVDCGDYLCQECFSGHQKSRLSMNHVLQDKSQISQERLNVSSAFSKDKCTEQCEHHSGRIVEYYCQDHESFGCSVCITMTHRQCTNVDHIPDLAQYLLSSQIYKQFQENASTLKMKYEEINNVAEANISTAEKSCSGVITAVRELREKINSEYDRMEEEICSQAESLKSNDTKKLIALCEKSTNMITEMEQLNSDFQCLESNNKLCQLFIEVIKAKSKLGSLFAIPDDIADKYSVRTYSFAHQPDIEHILNGTGSFGQIIFQDLAEIASIGNKSVTNEKEDEIRGQLSAQVEMADASKSPASDPTNMTAVHKKDMYVKTASDDWRSCNIGSSTLLSENKLVLVDSNQWKIKLLIVDLCKVVSELSMESKPYAVTTVNNEEVAVTLPDKEKIVFVKAVKLLHRKRVIPAGGRCRGIVYSSGKLIISFKRPARIAIMSLEGILESTIASHGDRPSHIAVSPECKTIYVADRGENTVKGIALDGTLKHMYKYKNLQKLGGITVDKFGHVIVCEEKLKKLHLLSPDCKKIKVLVDKLLWVRSVSYCHKSDKLFVGFVNDNIKMFQLFR